MENVKSLECTWTSAAQVIHDALHFIGHAQYTMADVMGLSTHALRITIHEKDVNAAGPTMYAPSELIEKPLNHFGYKMEQIGCHAPADRQSLNKVRDFIIDHLQQGHAVIGWDLHAPEFSLIVEANQEYFKYRHQCERVKYGFFYDETDMPEELEYKDEVVEDVMAYEKLNDLRFQNICVLAVVPHQSVEYKEVMIQSLEMTIEHMEEKSPVFISEYRHGLAAYEAWIQSLQKGTVDRFGLAYNTAIICDARHFAQQFFKNLPGRLGLKDNEILNTIARLQANYEQIAQYFTKLVFMFPFGQNYAMNQDTNEDSVQLLEKVRELEFKCYADLQQLNEYMSDSARD